MKKQDSNDSNEKATADENSEAEDATPKPVWEEGGLTHGHSSFNLFTIPGLIREKGCREVGGLMVRIYRTENAAEPICNRASADEKYTVVLTGTHEAAQEDLDVARLQKYGTKSRSLAMQAARHPSTWSKKAQTIVAKMAAEKEAKKEAVIAEAKAKAEKADAPEQS